MFKGKFTFPKDSTKSTEHLIAPSADFTLFFYFFHSSCRKKRFPSPSADFLYSSNVLCVTGPQCRKEQSFIFIIIRKSHHAASGKKEEISMQNFFYAFLTAFCYIKLYFDSFRPIHSSYFFSSSSSARGLWFCFSKLSQFHPRLVCFYRIFRFHTAVPLWSVSKENFMIRNYSSLSFISPRWLNEWYLTTD